MYARCTAAIQSSYNKLLISLEALTIAWSMRPASCSTSWCVSSSPDSLKLIFGQMMFLPGRNTRKHLNMPLQDSVDLRAACFCHRQIVDIGYVCSVCLSSMCLSQSLQFALMCSCSLLFGDSEVYYLRYKVLSCDSQALHSCCRTSYEWRDTVVSIQQPSSASQRPNCSIVQIRSSECHQEQHSRRNHHQRPDLLQQIEQARHTAFKSEIRDRQLLSAYGCDVWSMLEG